MARSIDTIYSLIIAEIDVKSELNGLNSESTTAVYRLWAWVTAAVLYTVEAMHDLFRIEIDTLLRTLKPGTLLWYQEMCKAFQYGDDLTWGNSGYSYAILDDAKKIVKQASVTEGSGGLTVKVATEVSGELEPLSAQQLHHLLYVCQQPIYITNFTWYRIKIIRTQSGAFSFLIKGGAFTPTAGYDGWTLVSVTGGSGTNPVTDNTYTTSNFFVLDLDAGDRFTNLVMKPGIEV